MPTVAWNTRIVSIAKADPEMTLIDAGPPEIYECDVDTLRLALIDLEDDEGMIEPDTHVHNSEVTVGGVTLARTVEFVNGYTVEFETGQYAVNLAGANTNLSDVAIVNQVSIRSGNTAGLIVGEGADPADVADAVWDEATAGHTDPLKFGGFVQSKLLTVSKFLGLK